MRRSWAALTVGILTLIVVAIGAAIFKYTSERISKKEGYAVFARFRDAMGLTEMSRVRSAGIDIGQIEKISLDQTVNKARVDIRIQHNIKIYENAIVAKKSESLLGQFYLDIDPGAPVGLKQGQRVQMRQLKDGDEITFVLEQVSTGQILDEVGSTLPILKDILRDVQSLTSGQVKEIADNVNRMISTNSVTLERLLNRVDNIAASIEGITRAEAEDIKITLRNIREITEGVKGLVGTSEGQVTKTGEQIRSSVESLQKSVASLEKSLGNIEKITGKIADGEGTVGHLVNDPDIAENVEAITEDAGTFIRGITRLQTIVGLRTEYNYAASTFKSYLQVQLAPRPDKFYLIEVVDDPRGFTKRTNTTGIDSRTGVYSVNEVETSDKLRLSFMFGKRLGPITGRFGIKESTGGVGLDFHMLEDRLMLSTDLFDAASNQYPRLAARLFVNLYKRTLFLIGGVDDVFNFRPTGGGASSFFDWFIGAQLQFNDQDLKQLLLFGGGSAAGASK